MSLSSRVAFAQALLALTNGLCCRIEYLPGEWFKANSFSNYVCCFTYSFNYNFNISCIKQSFDYRLKSSPNPRVLQSTSCRNSIGLLLLLAVSSSQCPPTASSDTTELVQYYLSCVIVCGKSNYTWLGDCEENKS